MNSSVAGQPLVNPTQPLTGTLPAPSSLAAVILYKISLTALLLSLISCLTRIFGILVHKQDVVELTSYLFSIDQKNRNLLVNIIEFFLYYPVSITAIFFFLSLTCYGRYYLDKQKKVEFERQKADLISEKKRLEDELKEFDKSQSQKLMTDFTAFLTEQQRTEEEDLKRQAAFITRELQKTELCNRVIVQKNTQPSDNGSDTKLNQPVSSAGNNPLDQSR